MHKEILANGLRLGCIGQSHRNLLSLGLFIRHGTEHEDFDNSGISHYIEHVYFQPKSLAPEPGRLFQELVDEGLRYEAYTSKEYTRLQATCFPEQMERAVELMGKIAQEPSPRPEAVEQERPILLHEHAMAFSSSKIVFNEMLDHALWGDHSLGLFVVGRKENIARFQCDDLAERHRVYCVPERSFLIALGPVDPEHFTAVAGEAFSGWRSTGAPVAEPAVRFDPKMLAMPRTASRVDLMLGYLGVPFASPDRFAQESLADVLAIRLFLELRERQALVYYVHCYPVTYDLGGYLAIRVNCASADAGKVVEEIKRQIERVRSGDLTKAELARVQAGRSMDALDALDNSTRYMQLLGRRCIVSESLDLEGEMGRIRGVGIEDVVRMAGEILVEERAAVVGFGFNEPELASLF